MAQDISYYKGRLEEEKMAVLNGLREVGADIHDDEREHWEPKVSDVDALRSDVSDVADRLETYEENTAVIRRLNSRLTELNSALKKITVGDQAFGKCVICGIEIEKDRLTANPAAATCKKHIGTKI